MSATSRRPRRIAWTLLALLLAGAALTGCQDGEDKDEGTGSAGSTVPPSPASDPAGPTPSDDSLLEALSRDAEAWLARLAEPTEVDLACPASDAMVDVNGADGAASADLQACFVPADQIGPASLRVQNLTDVPVTVWGASALMSWTLRPDAVADVPLGDPRFGDVFSFRPDLAAGLTLAIVDLYDDKTTSESEKWAGCAHAPDRDCLVGQAAQLLPERVRIRGWNLPAREVAGQLASLWEQKPLAEAFWQRASNRDGGRLTLLEAQARS
jgi:hypothetical protein